MNFCPNFVQISVLKFKHSKEITSDYFQVAR